MKIAPTCAFSVVVGCLLAQSHGVFGSPSLRNRKDERKLDGHPGGHHDPYGHPQGPYGYSQGHEYHPPLPPPLPYGGQGVEGQYYYYSNPLLPPLPPGTVEPSPRPTERPSPAPTHLPTPRPTSAPSPRPSPGPTPRPTERPTPVPTSARPTLRPTPFPTEGPSKKPTQPPSVSPTNKPTNSPPTPEPTSPPNTDFPSESLEPSEVPTNSEEPTESPSSSVEPSDGPSSSAEPSESFEPSSVPTGSPAPTLSPTNPVPITVARTICDPNNSPETLDFCRLTIVTGFAFILNDFEHLDDRFIPDPLDNDFIRDLGLVPQPQVQIQNTVPTTRGLDTNNRALLSGTGKNGRYLESNIALPSFEDLQSFFSTNFDDFFRENPLQAGDNFDEFISTVRSELDNRNITVFVPTNDAFAALNSDIVAALSGADDAAAVVYDILESHSVAGATVFYNDLVCNDDVTMANGEKTSTLCSGFDRFQVGINNNEVDIKCTIDASQTCPGNFPKIIREESDIEATNGVVHIIDNVILPAVTTVSPVPSASPTISPMPSASPSKGPSPAPTISPEPTKAPTNAPTRSPTKPPTKSPTRPPTKAPTRNPTRSPTRKPTRAPTRSPTRSPTNSPTSKSDKARSFFVVTGGIP